MGLAGLGSGDRARARRVCRSSLSRRIALLAGVASLALTGTSALAQERPAAAGTPATAQAAQAAGTASNAAPNTGATVLDQITVVSRTGETAIDTLASVSHIDEQQIERRMPVTPGDVFFGVPGITAQTDAKRAATSINIRGLQDFGRVAVIVDGARQNFQRTGHGTQSVFFLDPELIQEVDVIRGPVANTYGSGAIGGVVFYETKDAADFLRGRRDLGGIRHGPISTPTAAAGRPARQAPTASTKRPTFSATSSGAIMATTRTATATRSAVRASRC